MRWHKKITVNRDLFGKTSHSPSLADMVGEEMSAKITDFCFIANPYYPDRCLMRRLQKKLPVLIKSYPSSNPQVWQQRLSQTLHVRPESLVVGNGATELITAIMSRLVSDIAIPIPTFSEYLDKIDKPENAGLYRLLPEQNYQLNLDDYAAWINENGITAALIINPGNPTGQLLSQAEMMNFLDRMAHLRMIIVDESFIEFAGENIPSLLPYIDRFRNLVLVRSMSKHCGISGLRLGYCCSSNSDFLTEIRRLLPAWNINSLAEYFLSQLACTDAQYHRARLRVIEDMHHLSEELAKIEGFQVYPTGSNFVLIKSLLGITAAELQLILLEKYRAYVRDCSNKEGLDNYHIRVASQGRRKDKILINALKEISRAAFSLKK